MVPLDVRGCPSMHRLFGSLCHLLGLEMPDDWTSRDSKRHARPWGLVEPTTAPPPNVKRKCDIFCEIPRWMYMDGVCRSQASVEGHPRHARRGGRAAAAARACMRGVDRRFAARCRRLEYSASTVCFARHVAPAGLWPAASCDIAARVAAAERRVPRAFLAKRGSSTSGTSRPSTARPAGPVRPHPRRAMSRTSCTACMPRDS